MGSFCKWSGAVLLATALIVTGGGVRPFANAVASSSVTDPVFVAAGDIACSPSDWSFAGNDPTSCQMRATANEIASIAPRYLLPVGDTQYNDFSLPQGTEPTSADYADSYDPTWGRLGSRVTGLIVRPVAGNHEYGDLTDSDEPPLASGGTYFANFGPGGLNELPPGVTDAPTDHYSYDVPVSGGSWHVIEIDSECAAVGGCGSGSPEETWLRNDLAAHPNSCTIAAWHEPRWASGGAGDDTEYSAFWNDLASAHAALVLNGHDHFYQHFGPMDASGNATTTGVSEFIVGTGGEGHQSIGPPTHTLMAQDGNDFGALKLTLHAASASYAMQTTSGGIVDSGSVACPGKPISAQATFTNPTDGQKNVDTTQPFTWTAVPGAQGYYLTVGTTIGGRGLVNSGALPSTQTSFYVGLPSGKTLHARIYTKINGKYQHYQDISFTAAPGGKAMFISPTNGQTGVTATQPVSWSAAAPGRGATTSGSGPPLAPTTWSTPAPSHPR